MNLATLPLFEINIQAGREYETYLHNAICAAIAERQVREVLRKRFFCFKVLSIKKLHNGL